ncbi:MAG: Flp pilus assembly protein CpaB [Chloroflexi bacterium RBG_16_48_8]|nr:MAG: Flp pilus assembly protein CpaB [Chloroflexi bacterium RBG_16_48_8]
MNRRRGILIAFVGIAIAGVGIYIVFQLIQRVTTSKAQPTPPAPITEQVLVATHDIPIQTILNREDITVIEVPLALVSPNSLSDIEAVVGRITKVPLVSGEILMKHHIADPTNIQADVAFVIEDDQVLMAFPADDLMSQINILEPGDLVDILVSLDQPVLPGQVGFTGASGEEEKPEEVLFTFNVLQRVAISAVVVEIIPNRQTSSSITTGARTTGEEGVLQPTATPEASQIEPQALLLALDPQDALVLKHIKDAGGIIDIVLRAPTSNQIFDLNPVMPEYLRDRYNLVITR